MSEGPAQSSPSHSNPSFCPQFHGSTPLDHSSGGCPSVLQKPPPSAAARQPGRPRQQRPAHLVGRSPGPPLGRPSALDASIQGDRRQCSRAPRTDMAEAEFFRNLAAMVISSVVVVEDNLEYCAGCVLLKTGTDTFVLTKAKNLEQSGLRVHFNGNGVKPARCLASDGKFSILSIGEVYGACNSVIWKDPVDVSDALIFVPKSTSDYEKIKGFISNPRCEFAAGNKPADSTLRGSEHLFMTLCHHKETKRMVSTPVFNTRGEANGVVFEDCTSEDKEDGSVHKICMSATGVNEAINAMLNVDNWQNFLSGKAQKDGSKKKGGEASRHKSG